jgi:hypothetical protein
MHSVVAIAAFVAYALAVFTMKRVTYPKHAEPPKPFPFGWEKGHEYTLALSQDFWWAKRFKGMIKKFQPEPIRKALLKQYVKVNNRLNLWASIALTALIFILHAIDHRSLLFQLLLAAGVIRFVSRSFEVAYAFGQDVLQNSDNTTGLTKFERIKLALISYVEVFVYSAGAYLALPSTKGIVEAVAISFNVGTLTNVGFAFPDRNDLACNTLVFIQVFATLSLVVLSLTSYVSREK